MINLSDWSIEEVHFTLYVTAKEHAVDVFQAEHPTSLFVHLEKFSQHLSSSPFVIRVNLLHS